jgi:hypothetical protein
MAMKTRIFAAVLAFCSLPAVVQAQNVSAKSTEIDVDFTPKVVIPSQPVITWISPEMDQSTLSTNKLTIKLEIESTTPLKNISIVVKENPNVAHRGSTNLVPKPTELNKMVVEKSLTLLDGTNFIEIVATDVNGGKTVSTKEVTTGTAAVAAVATLDRTDYALLFATDEYDNWGNLVNPVNDASAIGKELEQYYGFKVEIVKNATQEQMMIKLREYAQKKFQSMDQLFIFFAGHGYYDNTFGEGFVVAKNSLADDPARTTYLSHNRLRSVINNIQCNHTFLAMDVCFGGTFDPVLASSRALEDVYEEVTRSEFISRKLQYKTRRYITSGGKEYVSDGVPGKNSPFARKFLEALRSYGGKDGIITFTELRTYFERLKPEPRSGEFGDNEPGSDFVFVTSKD